MHWFLKFSFGIEHYMFRTVPLSIISSLALYTQQWYMSYRFANSLLASCQQFLYVLLCVQLKTPDDGQRNCVKHVDFYFKNKFEKLVHLIGFIIRIPATDHLNLCTVLFLVIYKQNALSVFI